MKKAPMNMLDMERLVTELSNTNGILAKDVEFYKQVIEDMRYDHQMYKDHIKTLTRVIETFEKVITNGK